MREMVNEVEFMFLNITGPTARVMFLLQYLS